MGFWKRSGRNTSGHKLPLIVHIAIVLALALGAAWVLWRLWSGTWALTLTEDLDDKARFEVAKIVLAIVGGVVFLTIGYRKQRDSEALTAPGTGPPSPGLVTAGGLPTKSAPPGGRD